MSAIPFAATKSPVSSARRRRAIGADAGPGQRGTSAIARAMSAAGSSPGRRRSELVREHRRELLGRAAAMEDRSGGGPSAIRHDHRADPGQDAERDLGNCIPRRACHEGWHGSASSKPRHKPCRLSAAHDRLVNRVEVHEQPRAVARVLRDASACPSSEGNRPMSAPAQTRACRSDETKPRTASSRSCRRRTARSRGISCAGRQRLGPAQRDDLHAVDVATRTCRSKRW